METTIEQLFFDVMKQQTKQITVHQKNPISSLCSKRIFINSLRANRMSEQMEFI